jgi:hypothetical protein
MNPVGIVPMIQMPSREDPGVAAEAVMAACDDIPCDCNCDCYDCVEPD